MGGRRGHAGAGGGGGGGAAARNTFASLADLLDDDSTHPWVHEMDAAEGGENGGRGGSRGSMAVQGQQGRPRMAGGRRAGTLAVARRNATWQVGLDEMVHVRRCMGGTRRRDDNASGRKHGNTQAAVNFIFHLLAIHRAASPRGPRRTYQGRSGVRPYGRARTPPATQRAEAVEPPPTTPTWASTRTHPSKGGLQDAHAPLRICRTAPTAAQGRPPRPASIVPEA